VIAKLLKVVAALLVLGVVGYFALPRLVCMKVPKQQKLANCNTNALVFTLACDHSPPYALVLGRDSSHQPLTFRGEVIIQNSTGTVARIEIASDRMTPCNWLPGLEGYILTWGQTNAGEQRLSELFRRGESYHVRVAFSEMPPADCSLWFSSMGRAKLW
jgi:hypothetical protein